ncbi:hypothetical protein F3087_44790 [Nocardia colli]|uniref:DUF8020 domain-containing protein n=1 Tax=Nocardia colli TaxID=2545717 RepID=A0A5N0DKT6_9NOCA|nr:hypothetical protein [Nocardia colli]KAA8877296.1 hypothetical protein F3087_44790 [Nocardia colli]
MKMQQLAATAFIAIAATGITAGTAYAEPTEATTALSRVEHGVGYTSELSQDHQGVSTTLTSGRFEISRDGTAVSVTAPDGVELARLPMAIQASGQQIHLAPQIGSDGTTLTLRSADAPGAAVSDVQEFRHSVKEIQQADKVQAIADAHDVVLLGCVPGAIVGGAIGAVIGALVGALLFVVGAIVTIPLAVLVGAALGCLIA